MYAASTQAALVVGAGTRIFHNEWGDDFAVTILHNLTKPINTPEGLNGSYLVPKEADD